jgi:MerR family transcriptional regulator, light-induced transcriptional regulator
MTDVVFCSPGDVAQALGVSTSTIKRWVDEGVLPAHKTAGGHRRILRADVLRLVREGNFPRLDLSRLVIPSRLEGADTGTLSHCLLESLRVGDIARTRSVIHGAYAAGVPMETLGDAVIAPAMSRLGHDWEAGRIDVMHEHRGTLLCTAVLHELRPALEANAETDRPVAAGGNPEGDHSLLASLLIQMVLLDAGWDAINLGPHTPLASFRVALIELKPRLVWLSASYLPEPERFLDEYGAFYNQAERAGVAVAVGGQAIEGLLRGVMPSTFHGACLTDLIAFARTLHPRPRPPKRGRPASQAP